MIRQTRFSPQPQPIMPATFESFGIKFLYPENWTLLARDEGEGDAGVTLELPSGGFFTIEREGEGRLAEEVVEEITQSIEEDYGEVEREEIQLEGAPRDERAVEFRFYYLDLLIISRLVVAEVDQGALVIQMQAESRDFDANQQVFLALLKQIRG